MRIIKLRMWHLFGELTTQRKNEDVKIVKNRKTQAKNR